MQTLKKIADILLTYSLVDSDGFNEEIPLIMSIKEKLEKNEELVFILPAFPAKSPSLEKTAGELPDFGEVLALKNLQELCLKVSEVYKPGARIIICSDGRVFSDVVLVSDEVIDRYNEGVMTILEEFNLDRLSLFRMDDLYSSLTPQELRNVLLNDFAAPLAEVKTKVSSDPEYKRLFNGIHRFLFEDLILLEKNKSRNSIHKMSKERSYELLRRSDAWSRLLNTYFKNHLRLSIHPHQLKSEKFGVKLIPSSSRWATPWHNVVVKIKDRFELMHKSEALKLNAKLKLERERYVYFEVTAV